jgi:hypothetical protein
MWMVTGGVSFDIFTILSFSCPEVRTLASVDAERLFVRNMRVFQHPALTIWAGFNTLHPKCIL